MKIFGLIVLVVVFIAVEYSACGVSDSTFDDGHSIWACSKSDTFNTEFHGVKNGQQVKGVICGGPLKGYTVRYY